MLVCRFSARFVVLSTLAFLCLPISSKAAAGLNYSAQLWKVSDGLPNSQVRGFCQGTNGLLYVATLEGLASFDGLTFRTVEPRTAQEMSRQHFIAAAATPDGSIWFSNGRGISRHLNGQILNYGVTNGLPSSYVLAIHSTREGQLYVGTERGLRVWKDGRFVEVTSDDPIGTNAVRALVQDAQGKLWIGCTNGLFQLDRGRMARYPLENGGSRERSVLALAEGLDGTLWVGMTGGLTRIGASGTTNYSARNGLLTNSVRALCQARNGTLWIGTPLGLQRLEHGTLPFITQQNSFAAEFDWNRESVFSIFEDAEENIWVGFNHGLIRLRGERFRVFSAREGLPSRMVNCVTEDRDGTMWIGTSAGVGRFRNGHLLQPLKMPVEVGAISNQRLSISSILEDSVGTMLLGTRNGVLEANPDRAVISIPLETTEGVVRAMLQTTNGYWLGTTDGLMEISIHGSARRIEPDGRTLGGVGVLARNGDRVWAGGESGVTLLEAKSAACLARYDVKQGLPGGRVTTLLVQTNGTAWVATESGGLSRIQNGTVCTLNPSSAALLSERITSLVEDDSGNLWMGCRRGIFRAAIADLSHAAEQKSTTVKCVAYGKEDGLRSLQCSGNNTQPAACKDHNGRLWFATVDGVAVIDARHLQINRAPPQILLRQTFVDGQPFPSDKESQVPPGRGNIQFEYTGVSLQAPDKVHFQYLLEGVDPNWVDAGTRRIAAYANLSPGDYRFMVRAGNSDEVWTAKPFSYSFTILPHFYQRTSFYAGVIGLVFLAAISLHLLRVRRHKLHEQKLAALVAERTEHLETAIKSMETFTYSMAHDLRGPLRSIQSLLSLWMEEHGKRFDPTEKDFAQRIERSVSKMDELMRDLLVYGLVAHASAAIERVNVQRVLEGICADLQPELLARNGQIDAHVGDTDVMANPLLLRQALTNLLTNAVKFVDPATTPHVHLRTERHQNSLRICIEDNGIGIPTEYQDKIFGLFERLDTQRKYPGTGVGLAIVAKATERMGGKVGVESVPGQGSRFWLELPTA